MNKIFIASANKHKISELRQMLAPLGIELYSALDYPNTDEVDEDQPDLRGNALKKARFWHEKTGLPTLADDTGLEVEALSGAPGVYSARYAGSNATYGDNLRKLLSEMKGVENRKARFRTVAALVDDRENLFEGICEGEITIEPKGSKGFGYDPVFKPDGFDKTFAELSSGEKNRISHRGKALEKVVRFLNS